MDWTSFWVGSTRPWISTLWTPWRRRWQVRVPPPTLSWSGSTECWTGCEKQPIRASGVDRGWSLCRLGRPNEVLGACSWAWRPLLQCWWWCLQVLRSDRPRCGIAVLETRRGGRWSPRKRWRGAVGRTSRFVHGSTLTPTAGCDRSSSWVPRPVRTRRFARSPAFRSPLLSFGGKRSTSGCSSCLCSTLGPWGGRQAHAKVSRWRRSSS